VRISRRDALRAGVALALAGAGVAVALARSGGYAVPDGVRLASLAPWEWIVVRELARRVCAPDDASVVSPDAADVVGFVDAYAAKMPYKMRRDVGRFLAYVEHVAPLGLGRGSRFSRLAPDAQDEVLASLESHGTELLRGGFEGIKALVFMGYYRDPRTWSVVGYDGPLLDRPAGGW
jgi:Gluconate 2-dehydrogenase subunit 3